MLHRNIADILDDPKKPVFWHILPATEPVQAALDLLCPSPPKNDERNDITLIVVSDDKGKFQANLGAKALLWAVHGQGLDPRTTPLETIMDNNCDTLRENDSVLDALELMALRGAESLTIIDGEARVLGVLSHQHLLRLVKAHLDAQMRAAQTRLFGAHVFSSTPR